MSRSRRFTLLAGILLIAVFLRFYHLTSLPPGLYPDEAMDGNNAVEVVESGHWQTFYLEDNGREGLYINLLAGMFKVWPVYEPWMIRLPAAVAGVLTVAGVALLVAELFGDATGLLAAFLLATSAWHITFSRIGFRAIFAPMLLAWSLYLLLKAVRSEELRLRWVSVAAAGVLYGLGFYTYIAFRITPLLFLLLIPFFKSRPGFWRRAAVFTAVVFATAAPIGLYFVHHPEDFMGRSAQISVTASGNPLRTFVSNTKRELLMLDVKGDDNVRHNVSKSPEVFWPVGILFWTGFVMGLRAIWSRETRTYPLFGLVLMYLWFVLAVLPAAASNEGIPHALRSILMLPPVVTFAAMGGVWAYAWMRSRLSLQMATGVAVLFCAGVGVYGYRHYFVTWAHDPKLATAFDVEYAEVGRRMNALPDAEPKYVVVSVTQPGAAGYYVRGIPMPAQTTMFLTKSFTDADQARKHIRYLLPEQMSEIPAGTPEREIFWIK